MTGLGALGSLTETLCLCPEYSPINEPSSLNSLPPSAYSTRLSLLTLSTATSSPFRVRLPFSGFSSLSLPSTTTGDGCSGSAHKQTHYSTVRLADVRKQHTRGSRRPLLSPTLSHITHTCAHTITGLYTAYRLLNAWLLSRTQTHTHSSYGFNASLQAVSRGGCSSCTAGKEAQGRLGRLATITPLIANCQGFRTKGNFKSL